MIKHRFTTEWSRTSDARIDAAAAHLAGLAFRLCMTVLLAKHRSMERGAVYSSCHFLPFIPAVSLKGSTCNKHVELFFRCGSQSVSERAVDVVLRACSLHAEECVSQGVDRTFDAHLSYGVACLRTSLCAEKVGMGDED